MKDVVLPPDPLKTSDFHDSAAYLTTNLALLSKVSFHPLQKHVLRSRSLLDCFHSLLTAFAGTMTLKTLLRQLRDSCKILRTIEQSLIKYEHQERARLQREMHPKPKSIFPETFHVDPGRVALESVVSDLAIATNLVSQYQAVLCGEPLSFHGIDAYSK